ncbi:MAG: YciI family protein [Gammaproteobacteria bacterium]
MYILVVNIIANQKTVEVHAERHRNWVKQCLQQGLFLAAGARTDQRGGVILAKSRDMGSLKKLLDEDIYVQAKVAEYQIITIDCKFTAPGYENLLEDMV